METKNNFTRTKKAYSSNSKNFHLQALPQGNYFEKFRKVFQSSKSNKKMFQNRRTFYGKLKTSDQRTTCQKVEIPLRIKEAKQKPRIFIKQQNQKAQNQTKNKETMSSKKISFKLAESRQRISLNTCYQTMDFSKKQEEADQKNLVNYQQFLKIGQSSSLQQSNHQWGKMIFSDTLGTGSYAKVKLGQSKGRKFAVKIYQKYKLLDIKKRKRVYSEINILKKIPIHPNIIHLYECLENKSQIHMIFENIPDSQTLLQYFKAKFLRLKIQEVKIIFLSILKGVSHIHSNGIAHRDIKPENILLFFDEDEKIQIKIIDFGFSTKIKKTETQCGTPNFMSPQIFNKYQKHDPIKADIWALGVTLFYLCQGRYPFKGFDQRQLIKIIKAGKYQPSKITESSILQILNNTLVSDPNERWTVQKIMNSPWFSD